MLYYSDATYKVFKGSVSLAEASFHRGWTLHLPAPTAFIFRLAVPGRAYYFCALTAVEMEEWHGAVLEEQGLSGGPMSSSSGRASESASGSMAKLVGAIVAVVVGSVATAGADVDISLARVAMPSGPIPGVCVPLADVPPGNCAVGRVSWAASSEGCTSADSARALAMPRSPRRPAPRVSRFSTEVMLAPGDL